MPDEALPTCRECGADLRTIAVFCDRCGTPRLAPPGARGAVPWGVALGMALLLGAFAGGAAVYFLAPRLEASDPAGAWGTPTADVAGLAERGAGARGETAAEPATSLSIDSPRPPERIDVEPPPAAEAAPLDRSPNGVRERCGAAVLALTALDAEGDARATVAAAAVGERTLLAPFSAIEGAASASVAGSGRFSAAVAGVIAHDSIHDLALLAVDATLPPPYLPIVGDALAAKAEAVLLGPAGDAAWREAAVAVSPGAADRFSGGPRWFVEPKARTAGAIVDRDGRLLALVAEPAGTAIAAAPAAAWNTAGAVIPLETFRLSAGPGSPAARARSARKLLEQRRYEEAAREYLAITAEEPRLLDDVRVDLATAAIEAARAHVADGNGIAAAQLAVEALARVPAVADLHGMKARGLALAGEATNAVRAFLAAAEVEPARAAPFLAEAKGVLLDQVNALHGQGRTAEGLGLLLELRRSFPTDGPLRVLAGDLLVQQRRFPEAATLFSEAALLDASVAAEAKQKAEHARDLAGGPGAIVLDFAAGAADLVVDARINAAVSVRLRIDPAEENVVIPEWAAERAGYVLASAARVRYFADGAKPLVPALQLNSLSVRGIAAGQVKAVVANDLAAPVADGILGRAFLDRFRRVEDRGLGRLVLWPK